METKPNPNIHSGTARSHQYSVCDDQREDARQTCGLNFFRRIFDGISKIMYGTKSIVKEVLNLVPSSIFNSSLRPIIDAFPMLTLSCHLAHLASILRARLLTDPRTRAHTWHIDMGLCASQSWPRACAHRSPVTVGNSRFRHRGPVIGYRRKEEASLRRESISDFVRHNTSRKLT